jgi:hypothetical protein
MLPLGKTMVTFAQSNQKESRVLAKKMVVQNSLLKLIKVMEQEQVTDTSINHDINNNNKNYNELTPSNICNKPNFSETEYNNESMEVGSTCVEDSESVCYKAQDINTERTEQVINGGNSEQISTLENSESVIYNKIDSIICAENSESTMKTENNESCANLDNSEPVSNTEIYKDFIELEIFVQSGDAETDIEIEKIVGIVNADNSVNVFDDRSNAATDQNSELDISLNCKESNVTILDEFNGSVVAGVNDESIGGKETEIDEYFQQAYSVIGESSFIGNNRDKNSVKDITTNVENETCLDLGENEEYEDINNDKDANDPDYNPSEEGEYASPSEDDIDHEETVENESVKANDKQNGKGERQRHRNKQLRMSGNAYKGMKKVDGKWGFHVEKSARTLSEKRCSSRCQTSNIKNCKTVTEADRREIFTNFWTNMTTWDERRVYVNSLINAKAVEEPTLENGKPSRRTRTLTYHLRINEERIVVCKQLFLSTLGLGEQTVYQWIEQSISGVPDRSAEKKQKQSGSNMPFKCLIQFLNPNFFSI